MKGQKPDYIVKSVKGLGHEDPRKPGKEASRFTDIGVAYVNRERDIITISLNALPISDRIVLMRPLPPREEKPAEQPKSYGFKRY